MAYPASDSPTLRQNSRLHVLALALSAPQRYFSPWYVAYLLRGILILGLLPVLLPLHVAQISHDLMQVAWVVGFYNIGLLTSPGWGWLAERLSWHRQLFYTGILLFAAGAIWLALSASLEWWLLASTLMGLGGGASGTLGTLFIIDFYPDHEWEERIGYLQGIGTVGQIFGLLLAAAFTRAAPQWGLILGGVIVLPALYIGWRFLPLARGTRTDAARARTIDWNALAAFPSNLLLGGIHWHGYRANLLGFKRLRLNLLQTPFGRFLSSWFTLSLGVAAFFAYFPLLLAHEYRLAAFYSSLTYALAAVIRVPLFAVASYLAQKWGSLLSYHLGLGIRSIALLILLVAAVVPLPQRALFAAVGFGLLLTSWPFLTVAANGLSARLAQFNHGAAVGLMNAALALGTLLGTFLGAPLVRHLGYLALIVLAIIGVVGAGWVGRTLPPRPTHPLPGPPFDQDLAGDGSNLPVA